MSKDSLTIFTIGHSNYTLGDFFKVIETYSINCLVDVRSSPYSKYVPQYNKDKITPEVLGRNLKYVYKGKQLGARQSNPDLLFPEGGVDYQKVELTAGFIQGISEAIDLISSKGQVALLCAEKDPFFCHRFILLGRALKKQGIVVQHILQNNAVCDQDSLEMRLLQEYPVKEQQFGLFESNDNFQSRSELERAYFFHNKFVASGRKKR
jgi:uncharacterized protein (DUF488 family)